MPAVIFSYGNYFVIMPLFKLRLEVHDQHYTITQLIINYVTLNVTLHNINDFKYKIQRKKSNMLKSYTHLTVTTVLLLYTPNITILSIHDLILLLLEALNTN